MDTFLLMEKKVSSAEPLSEFNDIYIQDANNLSAEEVIFKIHMIAAPLHLKTGIADACCSIYGENPKVRLAAGSTCHEIRLLYDKERHTEKRYYVKKVSEKIQELTKVKKKLKQELILKKVMMQ